MEAKWDEMRHMLTLPEHGIPRAEWERRFRDELRRLADAAQSAGVSEEQVIAALLYIEPLRLGSTCICRGEARILFANGGGR